MEVCQVLHHTISEMYVRGRVSVTYVTRNGLAAVARYGLEFTRRCKTVLVRECQLDGKPEVDGYNVSVAQFSQEELYVAISISGPAERVILRSLKVQMSRDRLPIAFNKATGSSILER